MQVKLVHVSSVASLVDVVSSIVLFESILVQVHCERRFYCFTFSWNNTCETGTQPWREDRCLALKLNDEACPRLKRERVMAMLDCQRERVTRLFHSS